VVQRDFDFKAPDEFPDLAAATGAVLIGPQTHEVGNIVEAPTADDLLFQSGSSVQWRKAQTPLHSVRRPTGRVATAMAGFNAQSSVRSRRCLLIRTNTTVASSGRPHLAVEAG
jgi:hypothetical protein